MRSTVALFVLLALTACTSGPPPKPLRQMVLGYNAAPPAASTGPRLALRAVNIPDYLDTRQMLRRASAAEVLPDASAEWAERPGKAITRWVALKLGALRADYSVHHGMISDGRAPDAVLAIGLDSFEPGPDAVLRLRGSWSFANNGQKQSKSGRFDAEVEMKGLDADAQVLALQQALEVAVTGLAAQLPAP